VFVPTVLAFEQFDPFFFLFPELSLRIFLFFFLGFFLLERKNWYVTIFFQQKKIKNRKKQSKEKDFEQAQGYRRLRSVLQRIKFN